MILGVSKDVRRPGSAGRQPRPRDTQKTRKRPHGGPTQNRTGVLSRELLFPFPGPSPPYDLKVENNFTVKAWKSVPPVVSCCHASKNPGGAGATPPLPLSHRNLALSSNFTMAPWESTPFPYDLKVGIAYDVNLENNSYPPAINGREAWRVKNPGASSEALTTGRQVPTDLCASGGIATFLLGPGHRRR